MQVTHLVAHQRICATRTSTPPLKEKWEEQRKVDTCTYATRVIPFRYVCVVCMRGWLPFFLLLTMLCILSI